ncbi:hypothetical protein L6452_09168 [Arctium lappa]|uniref:Uncharacterized protein n=1 Tax=Arctium lappa TaxID=4217 RepID=A0ACB9DJA1_ARCLA|nr:hypothetical protein L6452_09168 [Arctium lappa]
MFTSSILRDDPWFRTLGKTCIHMTWSDRGTISLEGLGLMVVENLEEADFILVLGTEAFWGFLLETLFPRSLRSLRRFWSNVQLKESLWW